MRFIGAALIGACIYIFGRERVKLAGSRLLILEELLRFIEAMKIDIACYLSTVGEMPKNFSSYALSETGFLSDISKIGYIGAYRNLDAHISFSEREKKILERLFSLMGKSFIDNEIKLFEESIDELSRVVGEEREKTGKYKRLVSSISVALMLSVVILVI